MDHDAVSFCNRRSLSSGPCNTCPICTRIENPVPEWKDTGASVYSMVPLDPNHLDQHRINKYYLPYIRQLEAVKPRTYLLNHTNDRNILKWIQEAVPIVEDNQLHFPDCTDPKCLFRSTLPSEHIPYRGWNAWGEICGLTENPHVTYGRSDNLWSFAIRQGARYPEQKSYGNTLWHNIHTDVPLNY
jgi:hypothetical protein